MKNSNILSFSPLLPGAKITYIPDTHLYEFNFKSYDNNGTIRRRRIVDDFVAYAIPNMELNIDSTTATWSLTRQPPELSRILQLDRVEESSFHQYFEATFKEFNESEAAWHLCRI